MWRPLLAATLVVAAVPAIAPSAVGGENRYQTYVACGVGAHADPSHVCDRQGRKAAFFKSRDADVTYRVCVRFPDEHRLCADAQDATEDELKVNEITSSQRGRHVVTWFVDGERVGRWAFRNKNL